MDTIALSSSAVTTAVTSTIQQQRHHHRHGQGHAAHLGRIPVPSRVTKHRVAGAAPRALTTAGLPRPFVQVTTRQACARSSAATPTWERKSVLPSLANAIWPYATAAEWTPAGAGTKGGQWNHGPRTQPAGSYTQSSFRRGHHGSTNRGNMESHATHTCRSYTQSFLKVEGISTHTAR